MKPSDTLRTPFFQIGIGTMSAFMAILILDLPLVMEMAIAVIATFLSYEFFDWLWDRIFE